MNEQEKQALNREIAEALGWRIEQGYSRDAREHFYTLYAPNTTKFVGVWGTEEQAAAHLPAYTDDLNAVAGALPGGERGCGIELSTKWKGKFRAVIRDFAIRDNVNSHAYVADADTRHEAAARALLAWALAQKG